MDKPNIISYNTYRRIAKTHDIKDKTITGKPITYNKLKHRVEHVERRHRCIDETVHTPFCETPEYNEIDILTELPSKKQLHYYMIKYIDGSINDHELNTVMSNYVKNK